MNSNNDQKLNNEEKVDEIDHLEPSTHDDENAYEQMQFIDDIDEDMGGVITAIRSSTHDSLQVASLKEFLARPVLAYTYSWDETGFTDTTESPWLDFFSNPHIKKKLDNFAFMQANLKAKVVINASPFLYGALLVSYRPLPNFTCEVPLTQTSTRFGADSTYNISCTPQSQTPHIILLPQNNMGGEIVMPWFYHKNWMNITSAADLTAMGTLYFQELVSLRSATNAATFDITVSVYLMAENVQVTGSTSALAAQSGKRNKKNNQADRAAPNEWSDKPVQKVASVVADIAGRLTTAPYIGPFAKATEMASNAIKGIATLFGWSNPPVIDNAMPMKNMPFHNLTTTGVSEPGATITIDAKNELSIDPRTVDLPPIDEMDLGYVCSKESLLTHFMWSDVDAKETTLFSALVQPNVNELSAVTPGNINYTIYAAPPVSHVSHLFRFWRGDLIFRFKVICTQYHKGRLSISWDPLYDIGTNTDIYTTSFNQVVDLAPDLDISIRIPYLQARQWLIVDKDLSDAWSAYRPRYGTTILRTPVTHITGTYNNGEIVVKVINELSGPEVDSEIAVLVFVKAADNFELALPEAPGDPTLSVLKPQSLVRTNEKTALVSPSHSGANAPIQNLNYMGETVKSLRTLLRRQVLEQIVTFTDYTPSGFFQELSFRFTKWPKSPGYNTFGPHLAQGVTSTTGVAYSYTQQSPFAWTVSCYVGMRGAIRRTFNADNMGNGANIVNSMRLWKRNSTNSTTGPLVNQRSIGTGLTAGTAYSTIASQMNLGADYSGFSGSALTNQWTQTGFQVELPHYYPTKFCATNPKNFYLGISEDYTNSEYYFVMMRLNGAAVATADNIALECYAGIGTDFNAFFFLNAPLIYKLASQPTAA